MSSGIALVLALRYRTLAVGALTSGPKPLTCPLPPVAVHELQHDSAAHGPAELQPHQREPVLRLQGYGHEEAFHGN